MDEMQTLELKRKGFVRVAALSRVVYYIEDGSKELLNTHGWDAVCKMDGNDEDIA
jgi:hypothetical protein